MTLSEDNFPKGAATHVVQTGEKIADVAEAYGLSTAELYQLNAGVLDRAASARGFGHSEGGRIVYPGTILKLHK
jgi:hypothetical protein